MSGFRGGLGAFVLAGAAVAAPGAAHAAEPSPLTALVDAAAVRLQTADPVAAVKWLGGSDIDDPARVDQVLAAVTADARMAGVDADYVRRVFTDQIDATEAVEYTRFAQWKLDPAAAPETAPDLSASRSTIDGLNHTMVAEIASHWQELQSLQCDADRDSAVTAVADAHRLDALYRQALDFATRSYCQA